MSYFDELNAFVTVVERGSFSKAAEQIGIVKSAISKKVSDLEKRLGVKLLNRTTRRLNLTSSGKAYFDRAKQILQDVAEAEHAISSEDAALQGNLKIAAPVSFGIRHLMPAINDFMRQHPAIQLDVDFNDRMINVVEEGFDLAIRAGNLSDSSLQARRIASVNFVICASPGYLKKWGIPKTPLELKSHNCLVYSNTGRVWHFIDPSGKPLDLALSPTLKSNNGDTLLTAAEAGLGIIYSPDFICYQSIKEGKLQSVLENYVDEPFQVYAVYPQTRYLSHRVRKFIDFLSDRFKGKVGWYLAS